MASLWRHIAFKRRNAVSCAGSEQGRLSRHSPCAEVMHGLLAPNLCPSMLGFVLQAFEQGGGGKKAEAMRALAEAKAKAKSAAKTGNGQPVTQDSSASREGPDPR